MALIKVSLQNLFEIHCRTRRGRLVTSYCHGLEHAREIGTRAANESNSEISIDYYTDILVDSHDSPEEEHFGNVHFTLSGLLSTDETVLADSRGRAGEEIDKYMAQKYDVIPSGDPDQPIFTFEVVKRFRTVAH